MGWVMQEEMERSASNLRRWIQDMVHRKETLETLRQSEVFFREITENSCDIILIVDKEGRITYASPSLTRFLGYRPEEIIGKNGFDLIHPTDIQRAMLDFAEARRMNELAIPNSFRVLHKDGSERILEGLGRNLLHNPTIAGFIMNVHDITERKRTEEALQESEARWQFALEGAGDGVWDWNAQTNEVFFSRQWKAMLGFEEHEIGNSLAEWDKRVHPDDYGHVYAEINKHFTGQTPIYVSEHRIKCKDGTYKWILDRGKVIRWTEDGKPLRVIGTHTDITERKRAEEARLELERRLQKAQKAESLGRMAGAIAHHFNNQLQAVQGNLELTMEELPQDAGPVDALTEAMNATRRAAEVSGLMLTYLGKSPGKQELLDLSEACHLSLPMLRAAIPEDIVVETDLASPGPAIRGNMNQMQQVLTNLLSNAWESMAEGGGAIRLSVRTVAAADIPASHRFPSDWQPQDNPYACLDVADTGRGISEEDIEKLFDPFFTTKFTGRGLGLSVVLGIVRTHAGVVTVEGGIGIRKPDGGKTQGDGGSVFRVFLPLIAETRLPEGRPEG